MLPLQGAQVRSLAGELKSSMLHSEAKKKKGNRTDNISHAHHGLKLAAATLDPQYGQPMGFPQEEMWREYNDLRAISLQCVGFLIT